VITKDAIHFAFKGNDNEIDYIPLAEIVLINAAKASDIGSELNNKDVQHMEGEHTIQLSTEPDGHNSGRLYYFRLFSKQNIDVLTRDMKKYARDARKRRDNHNIFQRFQLKVRRVYESTPAKAFIILLITLVTPCTTVRFFEGSVPPHRKTLHSLQTRTDPIPP
jgi:hypothetical protein